jgi:RimJ/RimL family protein N-acetyltransferase
MNKDDAHAIRAWQYEEPYTIYNVGGEPDEENLDSEMLDPRSPYYSVRDEHGELIGYFCYGTAGQPFDSGEPGLYTDNHTITIGLGLRPDLTGKGLGPGFVEAGLNFARQHFAPRAFRLYVMTFNQRAIRTYEKAGFQHERVYTQRNIHGEHEFLVMSREA